VRAATTKALKHCYETNRPYVLEMQTYRYRGHSMSDPDQTYRTKDEIKKAMETNDPIERFKAELLKSKVLTEAEINTIDAAAKEEAEASAVFAEESPFPPPSEIMTDVYTDATLAQKY
jgi:pyruvate dehydrogenase E1 component alpha subunit